MALSRKASLGPVLVGTVIGRGGDVLRKRAAPQRPVAVKQCTTITPRPPSSLLSISHHPLSTTSLSFDHGSPHSCHRDHQVLPGPYARLVALGLGALGSHVPFLPFSFIRDAYRRRA